MGTKEKGPALTGPARNTTHPHFRLSEPWSQVGDYSWRATRGLLVLSDHVALFGAVRWPCGNYRTPLPGDYLAGRAAP